MTTNNNKDFTNISVSLPKKIISVIDKLMEMGLFTSRSEFARNAVINDVKKIANLKEMIDVLTEFETICEKKGLSEEQEAKKYFKWLKNGFYNANVIAKINDTEPVRVKELLKKHFNLVIN